MPNQIHEVFAYLRVKNAPAAIEFYQRLFGAEEKFRLTEPSGRIGHAELKIGPAVIMISEEYPEYGILGPESIGGTSVGMHLHVDNADELLDRAVKLGAKLTMPPQDQFYGERVGRMEDPFGHVWLIGHHIEDVAPEEMQRRFDAMFPA
ncbi:MAG: VOC family protein [Planctomycetaceae bacterium]|nr:VOC family protein [Planctomycetaceae bacterium]